MATNFTKLLAVKSGGGNPSTPAVGDTLTLGFTAFNLTAPFDLTGAFDVLGDSNLDGNATVSGTLGVTGKTSLTSDLAVGGNATFAGNVSVSGTLITKNTESVLISDNFLDMNSDLTALGNENTGFTFNYKPIANAVISSFSAGNIINVAAPIAGLAKGCFLMIAGLDAGLESNEGIYQVDTVNQQTGAITIDNAATLGFVKKSLTAAAAPGATAKVAYINLGVLQVSDGDLQWAEGPNSAMVFGNVLYDGITCATQTWHTDVTNTGSFTNTGAVSVIGAFTNSGDISIVNSGQSQFAFSIKEIAGALDAPASDTGAIYTKDSASITELFYRGDGAGPVQITKNGGLNIEILDFSLQEAYIDGNGIQINDANRPVSIDINGKNGNALEVIGPVSFTGTLGVSAKTSLGGALTVAGTSAVEALSAKNTSITGTLAATGDVTFSAALAVSGASTLASLGVTDNATVGGTLGVTGATSLTGTLDVIDAATFGGAITATGKASLQGALDVTGAAWLKSTAQVDGTLTANGAAWLKSGLVVDGDVDTDTLTVSGNSALTGTLAVSGASTLASLGVTNNATVGGTLGVTGDSTLTGQLVANGKAFLNGITKVSNTLTVTGDSTLAGLSAGASSLASLGVSGNSVLTGTLGVTGATSVTTITSSGAADFNSLTVQLTSHLIGAVTADGALTVSGATDVQALSAKATDITGKLTATDDVAFSAALAVSGNSTLASLSVTAAATVGGTLGVTGASTLAGLTAGASSLASLGVSGNATVSGTLGVSGLSTLDSASVTNDLTVHGEFSVDGSSTIASLSATSGSFSSTLGVTGVTSLTCATKLSTADADLKVAGYSSFAKDAKFAGAVELVGALSASSIAVSGNLTVGGTSSFDGGVFTVLSSDAINLRANGGNLDAFTSGLMTLSAASIASSINVQATADNIAPYSMVRMSSTGLVAAKANAQEVWPVGVTADPIEGWTQSGGKIVEFGQATVLVENGKSIAKGDRLYLSAIDAGCVTNAQPVASAELLEATVYFVGNALAAQVGSTVKVAVRQQFLYNTSYSA